LLARLGLKGADTLPLLPGAKIGLHIEGPTADLAIDIDASVAELRPADGAPLLTDLALKGKLRGTRLTVNQLSAKVAGGMVSVSGGLNLNASMSSQLTGRIEGLALAKVNRAMGQLGGQVNAQVVLRGPLVGSDARPLTLRASGAIRGVTLPGIGRRNIEMVTNLFIGKSLKLGPTTLTLPGCSVSAEGLLTPELALEWRAQVSNLARVLGKRGSEAMPRRVNASGTLRLRPELDLAFRVNTGAYSIGDIRIGSLSASGSVNPDRLRLRALRGKLAQGVLRGKFSVPFAHIERASGELHLEGADLPGGAGALTVTLRSAKGGSWSGFAEVVGLRAAGLALGDLAFGLAFDGERASLRALDWDEGLGILSGEIGLNLAEGRTDGALTLHVDQTGLAMLAGDRVGGRAVLMLRPRGTLESPAAQLKLSFQKLTLAGVPLGDGSLTAAVNAEGLGGLLQTRGNGEGRATIRLSKGFTHLETQLTLTAFRLASLPLGLPDLRGRADLTLRLSGPLALSQMSGSGSVRLREVRVADEELGSGRGNLRLALNKGLLHTDFELLTWARGHLGGALPDFAQMKGQIEITAERAELLVPALSRSGTELGIYGQLLLARRDGDPAGRLLLRELRVSNPELLAHDLTNVGEILVGYSGGRARIERLVLELGESKLELGGWIEPQDADGRVNLRLNSQLPLELLQLVDNNFALTQGSLAVEGSLRGKLYNQPDLQVTVEPLPGTRLLHSAYPRAVQFAAGRITLDQQTLRVDGLQIESGTGELKIDGAAELEGFIPQDVNFDIGLSQFLFRFGEQALESNADLTLSGPLEGARLSGQIALLRGNLVEQVDVTNFVFQGHRSGSGRSLTDLLGPYAATELDLEITSTEDVQVVAGLPVFKVAVNPTLDLRVGGTASEPLISGVVEVDEGNGAIIFPEARFVVDTASVDLSQDPYFVSLEATWDHLPRRRVDADEDSVITLKLGINGPLDRMELRLLAPDYPDLTRTQLLGMLARGQTPDTLINGSEAEGEGSYSDVALRMLTGQVFARFEKELESVLQATFQLPVDVAIDLGTETLRMQGVASLTDRLEVAGEAELVFGTGQQSEEAATTNANAASRATNRQNMRATFVLNDAWSAAADLRNGYQVDDDGEPLIEMLLELKWRVLAR
jgi:hypothetical protein